MATDRARVEIDASPESVFALLVEDRADFTKNNEIVFRERVGDRPMGVGYQYKGTFLHRRHRCETRFRISAFEAPWLLEESTSTAAKLIPASSKKAHESFPARS